MWLVFKAMRGLAFNIRNRQSMKVMLMKLLTHLQQHASVNSSEIQM